MTSMPIKTKLIDSHDGARTYLLTDARGTSLGYFDAATPRAAVEEYQDQRIAALQAEIKGMIAADAAKGVAEALVAGGAAIVQRTARGVMPYIEAARRKSFAARAA